MTLCLLPFASRRGAHPRRTGTHRMTLGVTLVAITAVVGSLLTAVAPAQASESTLAEARATISSSVNHGTYGDDILSGKITVEQLVDVTMDLRSTGGAPNAGPIPSRAEVTRQAVEAVASLRAAAAAPAAPELTPSTGSHPTTNPLLQDKHWWNHLTHWFGFKADAQELVGAGAATAAVGGILAGACFASGNVVCGGIAFLATAALVFMVAAAGNCLAQHHAFLYVSVPNFTASGCRD
jgi:hypothetical protein